MPLSRTSATFTVTGGAPGTPAVIVGAVTGKSIYVYGFLVSNAAGTAAAAEWEDTDAETLSGVMTLVANGTIVAHTSSIPCFRTAPGKGLNLQATTNNVTGYVIYSIGP